MPVLLFFNNPRFSAEAGSEVELFIISLQIFCCVGSFCTFVPESIYVAKLATQVSKLAT